MSHNQNSDSGIWSIDSLLASSNKNKEVVKELKRPERPATQFDTVLGSQCALKGSFSFNGRCQLDCALEGDISSEGDLYLGESSEVKASIQGQRVYILGRFIGDVVCSERLELFAGASISGNISSPRLVVHDGVIFDGYCQMAENSQLVQEPKTTNVVSLSTTL